MTAIGELISARIRAQLLDRLDELARVGLLMQERGRQLRADPPVPPGVRVNDTEGE